ncbi:MAG TPA: transglycosylase SLT domain-containing protein [Chitinophagales bacterium]|nr:transglycosylase SLT domain-containing protein [Chitinophagales bacterium]HQG37773.1 transglycosylase SLT domain-containing protein [Chitinophagales bacterium]
MQGQHSVPSQYSDSPKDLEVPTEAQLFKDDPDPVVLSAQIAVRLKKIQQTIPLDYNSHVQKYISYNTNEKRKVYLAKMLGRSKKFFPIFESILAQYGIPDEMKYLAVVESALNPFAVSRVGATGPWQFMYSTALRYNLNINKRIDERRDPYAACEAACRYLKETYNLYGNWQLAIASYNCGAGNVNRAIKKAGGSTNFWDVKPFLPAETQAYVPSFIAIVYAMKYAGKYGIVPQLLESENTQRITVRQKITVNDLEHFLSIPRQTIIDENPALLTTFIPPDFTLNLPVSRVVAFNQLQDSLYSIAQNEYAEQKLTTPNAIKPDNTGKYIAADNCIDSEDCNEDGTLKTTGKETTTVETKAEKESVYDKIKNFFYSTDNTTTKTATTNKSAAAKKEDWKEVPTVSSSKTQKNYSDQKEDDSNYKTIAYTVKKGDNLGNIASWFHCNVKEIRRWNNIIGNSINVNDELLIYVHKTDLKKFVRFNYLSKKIKEDLSAKITTYEEKEHTQKGNTPLIDKINPVKIYNNRDCFQMHKVKQGETLWSIAQKHDDVSVQEIVQWNKLKKNAVLHKGDNIKVKKIKCK